MADQGTTTTAGAQGAGDTGKTALESAGAATAAPVADKPAEAAAAASVPAKVDAPAKEKSLLEGAGEKTVEVDAKKPDAAVVAGPEYVKELKHPEGVEWNEGAFNAIAPALAAHKIPKEAAQALVDGWGAFQAAQAAAAAKEAQEMRQASRAECLKQFKTEDFQAARRALDRECKDEGLRKVLMDQLGDHPGFIGMLAKFGRAIADDSTPGATESGGGSGAVSRAEKFYGKQS
jgi:hypothetical protein